MAFVAPSTYASIANSGYYTQFAFGATAPGSPPTTADVVIEVKSVDLELFTAAEIDVTHLQSPQATEETISGLLKTGNVTLGGNYVGDATQDQMSSYAVTAAETGAVQYFEIVAPMQRGTKTYKANGQCFVVKWKKGPFENNKAIEFAATFKITGPVTEIVY